MWEKTNRQTCEMSRWSEVCSKRVKEDEKKKILMEWPVDKMSLVMDKSDDDESTTCELL